MEDLVVWIQRLFDDCVVRAPFGIGWHLDRADAPLSATVTPADCSTAQIVLSRNDLLGRIDFVARLQAFLDIELDRPVPPCPEHRIGLVPVRSFDHVHWHCPKGDFGCRIGDYSDAIWPPSADEDPGRVAPMLARRFSQRAVSGIFSFGVELRDGRWVAKINVSPQADIAAIRAAAEPVVVDVEQVKREAARTVQTHRPATETVAAHRALTLVGVAMPLALLCGRLRRAGAGDAYDFLVASTPVRLVPDHQLGPPGSSVVLDASGVPFAREGDAVCCVGGFVSSGPVQGETSVFSAAELRVYE